MTRPAAARRSTWLLAGAGLILLAAQPAYATKPTAPVVLTATVTAVDAVSGTATVEIAARSLIRAAGLTVKCELPAGAATVPGAGEWTTGRKGGPVLKLRVTLPPAGGRMIIRADVRGKGIQTGRITSVVLPPAKAAAKAAQPRVVKTSKGERLRLHK